MSLKPQPPREMPAEVARIGAELLPPESPYRLVGDQLYTKYRDEDYADLYPAEGRPGLSPVDLAFVTAFQYLEDLSDRLAADAVRLRLDWKYALHLPLDYPGFNFSVLSEYRARLVNHQAEARVFEALLIGSIRIALHWTFLRRRGPGPRRVARWAFILPCMLQFLRRTVESIYGVISAIDPPNVKPAIL